MIDTEIVTNAVGKLMESKRKVYPQHTNRISQLDDVCERRLFYRRTAYDKAQSKDNNFMGILETGTILEPLIMRIIGEIGEYSTPQFRIVGQQIITKDSLLDKYQISGTIDGMLQVKNGDGWKTEAVIDVKTSNPNIFQQLDGYESLGKYSWTKSYRGQLQLYALANNIDTCCLIFINKANLYDIKIITFPLDMQYAESLLQKADRVNQSIKTKIPPPQINNSDTCPNCAFFSFCCPELTTGRDLQICDNEELEAILNRLDELKPTTKEFDELEKQRDALLVRGADISCGKWLITWTKTTTNYKAKEASISETWRKKIIKAA